MELTTESTSLVFKEITDSNATLYLTLELSSSSSIRRTDKGIIKSSEIGSRRFETLKKNPEQRGSLFKVFVVSWML